MVIFQFFLFLILTITLGGFVYYSVQSRGDELTASLYIKYRGWMNIHMGICFLALATIQLTFPSSNWLRFLFIGFIYIIGFINLYYGIKRQRAASQTS